MSDQIILFDLPSREGFCWSYNPWKTRLVMNYKGIPYKTEWVEYPDLKPTFQKFGIPPDTSGPHAYTSPTIRLPSGEYLMDSRPIADKLESAYPTPSLHLDSPYQSRIEQFLPKLLGQMRPIFAPNVPKKFLNPRSREYFVATREKSIGMSLDEYYAKNADKAFEDVKPFVKELSEMYAENGEGPWLMGKEVCYADLMVLAVLRMMDRLEFGDRLWGMEGGERLKGVYDASGKWLERDSY